MSEKRSVAVRLLGHEYRIRTDADPAGVERIAGLVDQTMARIRKRTGAVDSLDLAVMAALNLANDLLSARPDEARSAEPEPERLRSLVDDVEALLTETDSGRS